MLKLDPKVARDWARSGAEPKGGYLTKGKPPEFFKGQIGISARDMADVISNLNITEEYLNFSAVKVMANIAIDLLSHSMPRVPYDTGELRESGTAVLLFGKPTKGRGGAYAKVVGRGTAGGNVNADISALKGKHKGRGYVSANVTFTRFNERGEDIALWAHYDLLPYEARPAKPAARKPGTGPLYLEGPYLERKNQYIGWIKDAFSYDKVEKDIRKGLSVKKRGTEYMVDTVKLRRFF